MADEKTINTRIQLKYDTLENWTEAKPVLKAGEVAIVAIPTESEGTVGQVTKPAIVFKVGDGTSNFNELPYASGLAADVYEWAKAAEKPSYSISDIDGWNTSVDEEVNSLITSALTELLESDDFASAVIEDVTETVAESLETAESYTDTSIAKLAGENGVSVTSGNYITGIKVVANTDTSENAPKYVLELTEEALPTTDLSNYYTKEEADAAISEAIAGVTQFDFKVADELPETGEKGVIYLIKCKDTTHKHDEDDDVYDEYIWVDSKWEKIGNTAIDLSGYVTTTAMDEKAEEVKKAIEGEISTLTESVQSLSSTVTTQEESISSLNEQINGSDDEDTGIVGQIENIESSIEEIQSTLNGKGEDTGDTGLVGDVSALQEKVEALQTSVADTMTYDVTSTVTGETEETATGLKITTTTTAKGENGAEENKTTFNVEFDKDVVFVFNCGTATELV